MLFEFLFLVQVGWMQTCWARERLHANRYYDLTDTDYSYKYDVWQGMWEFEKPYSKSPIVRLFCLFKHLADSLLSNWLAADLRTVYIPGHSDLIRFVWGSLGTTGGFPSPSMLACCAAIVLQSVQALDERTADVWLFHPRQHSSGELVCLFSH